MDTKSKNRNATKDTTRDAKPTVKKDVKATVKKDAKPDTKTAAKKDVKPDTKTAVKKDAKADTKTVVKKDAKADTKTVVKKDVKIVGSDAKNVQFSSEQVPTPTRRLTPSDEYGIDVKKLPDKTVIPTSDGTKWECYNKKWYKVPEYGSFDCVYADDSLMIIDPVNIIPGEKCTCGRPPTEFEKMGIYTYGDFLKKFTIKGRTVNPYGRNLKFSDNREGLAIVIRSFEKNSKNMIPVKFKKRSEHRVGDVIIRF